MTGTGTRMTEVTTIALCTSCSRAKKGEKHDINNYRPISVLPIITGIFERHISTCLIDFLDKHNLIIISLALDGIILVKPP